MAVAVIVSSGGDFKLPPAPAKVVVEVSTTETLAGRGGFLGRPLPLVPLNVLKCMRQNPSLFLCMHLLQPMTLHLMNPIAVRSLVVEI